MIGSGVGAPELTSDEKIQSTIVFHLSPVLVLFDLIVFEKHRHKQ